MVISALGFSLMALCVKIGNLRGFPVLELIAAKALISLFLSYWDVWRLGISPWGEQRTLLWLRGIIGFLALIAVYTALTLLPLAEATLIQYLNPIFTAILAFLFLGERIQKTTVACMVMGIIGLLVISQPQLLGGTPLPLAGVAIALLGAAGSGAAYTIVRRLSHREHPSVIILYFPLVCLPATIVFGWQDFIFPEGSDWILLLAIGLFTQVGQIGLTRGVAMVSAGKATGFSYIQVIFASLLGALFLDETLSISTLLGAIFIISGALINNWERK
ncbi:MAG: EamA family transporter [Gammaproteobacteria bacterium]|nr:EamA family transporter [Gammaproteobacteria bacterium]